MPISVCSKDWCERIVEYHVLCYDTSTYGNIAALVEKTRTTIKDAQLLIVVVVMHDASRDFSWQGRT